MRSVEEILAGTAKTARPPKHDLNTFCDYLSRRLHPARCHELPTVEDMAGLFRQFYRLSVPLRPQLAALLESAGIALIPHGNEAEKDAASEFNAETQQWELYLRYDIGLRETHAVLQQIFLIVARQAYERIAWWEDWLAAQGRQKLRQLADSFAYAVALPPAAFCNSAFVCGLNPWSLSATFLTPPGACFFMLMRRLQLPCPYFQAQLNFRPERLIQTHLRFEEQTVRAEVWKKGVKRVFGTAQKRWPEMERLGRLFPRRGTCLEAGGLLYQAIKERRPMLEVTCEVAGISLPAPVCLVARPNGTAQSQMFVQVVPADYRGLLMDDLLCEENKGTDAVFAS